MKRTVGCAIVSCVIASALILGQRQEQPDPERIGLPTITGETTAPDIPGVVKGGTKVQLLKIWDRKHGGEGPVAMPDSDDVLFTLDDPFRIGRINLNTGEMSTYIENGASRVLAVVYDLKGRLIGTQQRPAGIAILSPTSRSMLADTFEGKPISGANDLVVDAKGGIYFSGGGPESILYVTPQGGVIKASSAAARPNGIQLSADGKVVYTGTLPSDVITAHDVQPDGRLGPPRVFAQIADKGQPSGVDGMATDGAGRLYTSATAGVQVISPQGKILGTIPMPLKPRNLAFAGKDRKTLVVIARGGAFKISMLAEGPRGGRFK